MAKNQRFPRMDITMQPLQPFRRERLVSKGIRLIRKNRWRSAEKITLTDPDLVLEVGKTMVSVKDSKGNFRQCKVEYLGIPWVTAAFIGVRLVLSGVLVFYRLEEIFSVHHLEDDDGPQEGALRAVVGSRTPCLLAA